MRPTAALRDEGTARFIFQAAIGVGSFCTMASLYLSMQGASLGAAIFLLLALIGLGTTIYAGRIYFRLRRQRWNKELEQPNAALEQLFARARADQSPAPPADSPGANEDVDHA